MSDDADGCISFVGILLALAAILVALYILFVWVLPAIISVGALAGLSIGVSNYAKSFTRNVRPEFDPDGKIAKTLIILLSLAVVALIVFGVMYALDTGII